MFKSKEDFIKFTIEEDILRFGDFTLKSGRKSPYFFNTGLCYSGKLLSSLSSFYAEYIIDNHLSYDFIFGPAYKGITLCSSISQSLYNNYGIETTFAYNRKERKNHGDSGIFVGYPPNGNALIVDDVISSGSSIIDSLNLVQQYNASSNTALVAFDRMEIGKSAMATGELNKDYNIKVHSLINLDDIYKYILNDKKLVKHSTLMSEYISKYKGI